MPAPTPGLDWEAIRRAYVDGGSSVTLAAIARARGIPYTTIRDRSRRYGWSAQRQAAHPPLVKGVAQRAEQIAVRRVADRITAWVDDALEAAGIGVSRAAGMMSDPCVTARPRELAAAAGALEVCDRVGRRALGLDAQQPASVSVQVGIGTQLSLGGEPVTRLLESGTTSQVGSVQDISTSESVQPVVTPAV